MDMNIVVHVINSVLMYTKRWDRDGAWRPTDPQCFEYQEAMFSNLFQIKACKNMHWLILTLIINALLMQLKFHLIWSFHNAWLSTICVREKF